MNSEARPLTCMITAGECTDDNFRYTASTLLRSIDAAARGGVSMVQIREKKLSASYLFELAKSARSLTLTAETRIIINDRADIAIAADCHGVQLTSTSVEPEVIRKAFGERLEILVSVHSKEDVVAARKSGADMVLLAPIFATSGKSAIGLGMLRDVCEANIGYPVIALGGIDKSNYKDTLEAGAKGVAGIRCFQENELLDEISLDFR